jgi:hypothetical protein
MAANETILVKIDINTKEGVAALRALGYEASKTNSQFDKGATGVGKFGDSMKRIAGNVIGFGSVTALASTAVIGLVDNLMNAGSQFSKTELAAARLTNEIKNAKDGIQQFVDYLNMQAELDKLSTQLSLGKGFATDQEMIGIEIENNKNLIANSQSQIEKYNKSISNLRTNSSWLLSKGGQELLREFPSFDMTDDAINKLGSSDQLLIKKAKADFQFVESERQRIGKLDFENKKHEQQLQINHNEEMRRQREKALADYEKYVSDTIALGKQYAAALKNRYEVPEFTAFDSRNDQFEKARKLINDFKTMNLNVKPVTAPTDQLPTIFDVLKEDKVSRLKQNIRDIYATMNAPSKFGGNLSQPGGSILGDFEVVADAIRKARTELEELLETNEAIADQVSGVFSPAFENMFDAILNQEDALKAFFNGIGDSIKRLIKQLIAAAIQAAALSIITGGAGAGGYSFGSAFKKIMGFASGGLVTGPVSAMIGEGHGTSRSNPEVVAPLDRLQNFFRNMMGGPGGINSSNMGVSGSILRMPAYVEVRQRGRDLVGAISLEQMSQSKTG